MKQKSLPRFFAAAAVTAVGLVITACGTTAPDAPEVEAVARAPEAACQPITECYNALATCGTASDGCGGTLSCGPCPSGQVCTANNCYPADCKPMTCAEVGANCNETGDGCGGTLSCGTCPVGAYCNSIVCVQLCDNCLPMTIQTTEFQPCSAGVCFMGDGNVGEGFALSATALNGLAPELGAQNFTWTVVAGSLPAGLALAPSSTSISTTLIQGTPKTAGTSTFTLQVEDDVERTAQQSFHLTIGTGNLDLVTITGASYVRKPGFLEISADDDNLDAVLTAFVTATGAEIGTLTASSASTSWGPGSYSRAFEGVGEPTNVTVKSSRGASASSAVTVVGKY